MTTLELKLTPLRAGLQADRDNVVEVLVRAIAPQAPAGAPPRRRLNLSLVLDRSGSMGGHPLQEAKRCAAAIVDRLMPDDVVSVVTYDSDVRVVIPAQAISDSFAIKGAIQAIRPGGRTALHDGWAAGAEQAARHVKTADTSRVLLLSDGCANAGIVDPHIIADRCGQMAAVGVTTSTYGLGQHFNEDLMSEMARLGGGNAYYGQTASDLMGPFQDEFELLQATLAQQVRLRLEPAPGVRMTVASLTQTGADEWRLPDVAYGSEAWAIVTLQVPRHLVEGAQDRTLTLLRARLAYATLDGEAPPVGDVLALRVLPGPVFAELSADPLVARRLQEVRFAEYQVEAAEAARRGRWDRVDDILQRARATAAGNDWLSASMAALERYAAMRNEELFAKESTFKARRVMSRLASVNEDVAFDARSEAAVPRYLRRKLEEGRDDAGG